MYWSTTGVSDVPNPTTDVYWSTTGVSDVLNPISGLLLVGEMCSTLPGLLLE